MSRFPDKRQRLWLGCTADSAVLLAAPTPSAVQVLASVTIDPSPHNYIAALCDALPDLKPQPPVSTAATLDITVDDALARSFVVTPPSGAQGLNELRASAAARFAVLYAESAEQWLMAADWQATAPFIACALPRQLYQGLDSLVRMNGWRLNSVRPALVRVWNRLHPSIPPEGWLGVGFGQTLTLVHTSNEQATALRTLHLPDTTDVAELETLLEQERLRTPVPAEARDRQSLLWSGAAQWLPVAPTIAGLPSRVRPLRAYVLPPGDLSEPCQLACQLALAGN